MKRAKKSDSNLNFKYDFLFCVFVQEFMYFIPIAFHIEIYDSMIAFLQLIRELFCFVCLYIIKFLKKKIVFL